MFFITTSDALKQNKHTKLLIFLLPLKIFWKFFFSKYVKEVRASVDINIF